MNTATCIEHVMPIDYVDYLIVLNGVMAGPQKNHSGPCKQRVGDKTLSPTSINTRVHPFASHFDFDINIAFGLPSHPAVPYFAMTKSVPLQHNDGRSVD